jgi:predicted ABC-type ATPase
MPRIFLIGGPNGAGKTSSAMRLLPDEIECREFVNADAIAAGLSPFEPDTVALKAGRLMLERIHDLADRNVDFAFESTLAARSFAPFLRGVKRKGYEIDLIYLWLERVEIALQRVASRTRQGGHNVPEAVVRRRYKRGLSNLFDLYLPLADRWTLYDNSGDRPKRIALKTPGLNRVVEDFEAWKTMQMVIR